MLGSQGSSCPSTALAIATTQPQSPASAASPLGAAGDTGSKPAEGSWHCAGELPRGVWTWQRRCQPQAQLQQGSAQGFLLPAFPLYLQQGHTGTDAARGGICPLLPAEILRLKAAPAHFTVTLPLLPSGAGRFQRQPSSRRDQHGELSNSTNKEGGNAGSPLTTELVTTCPDSEGLLWGQPSRRQRSCPVTAHLHLHSLGEVPPRAEGNARRF